MYQNMHNSLTILKLIPPQNLYHISSEPFSIIFNPEVIIGAPADHSVWYQRQQWHLLHIEMVYCRPEQI